MTSNELAEELKKLIAMHGGSPYPAVHLFGIRFGDDLRGHNMKDVCIAAGISHNYAVEIGKGRRIGPFVDLK